MSRVGTDLVDVLSDPPQRDKCAKKVEELLEKTCRSLNETEVNIGLFGKMIRNGVATNDVRSFVSNQAELKRADHEINRSLTRKEVNLSMPAP